MGCGGTCGVGAAMAAASGRAHAEPLSLLQQQTEAPSGAPCCDACAAEHTAASAQMFRATHPVLRYATSFGGMQMMGNEPVMGPSGLVRLAPSGDPSTEDSLRSESDFGLGGGGSGGDSGGGVDTGLGGFDFGMGGGSGSGGSSGGGGADTTGMTPDQVRLQQQEFALAGSALSLTASTITSIVQSNNDRAKQQLDDQVRQTISDNNAAIAQSHDQAQIASLTAQNAALVQTHAALTAQQTSTLEKVGIGAVILGGLTWLFMRRR